MNLAASPQTAAFLNQEERQWVHDRQTQALVAKEAEAARSSNAWGAALLISTVLMLAVQHHLHC
jgi:hypothetical protein